MKKVVSLTLITILTITATVFLIRFVKLDGFQFAWTLNFLLMMAVVLFVDALNSPFTSSFYDQKSWEQRGKIYEVLGVNIFRKVLVAVGWEKLTRKANPIEKSTKSLENLYHQTKKSELGHIIIFLIVLGFNIYVAFEYGFLKSLWLLVLNVLLNLYPIFLQRYNRPRIQRAFALSKKQ